MHATPSASLDDLLIEFLNIQRLSNECRLSSDVLEAHLPDWAKPGPMYLYHDGRVDGPTVGWPQVAKMPAQPEHPSTFKRIRVSPREAWESATHLVFCPGKEDRRPIAVEMRRIARLRGFRAVRTVIARLREKKAFIASLGIDQLHKRWDRLSNRSWELQDEIKLRFGSDSNVEAIAVTLVMEIVIDCNIRERLDEQEGGTALAIMILARLVGDLTGVLRIIVDDILAGGDKTYHELLLGGGWPLAGCYSPGDETVVDAVARQMVEAA